MTSWPAPNMVMYPQSAGSGVATKGVRDEDPKEQVARRRDAGCVRHRRRIGRGHANAQRGGPPRWHGRGHLDRTGNVAFGREGAVDP